MKKIENSFHSSSLFSHCKQPLNFHLNLPKKPAPRVSIVTGVKNVVAGIKENISFFHLFLPRSGPLKLCLRLSDSCIKKNQHTQLFNLRVEVLLYPAFFFSICFSSCCLHDEDKGLFVILYERYKWVKSDVHHLRITVININ